jgi:hypothetical protein
MPPRRPSWGPLGSEQFGRNGQIPLLDHPDHLGLSVSAVQSARQAKPERQERRGNWCGWPLPANIGDHQDEGEGIFGGPFGSKWVYHP